MPLPAIIATAITIVGAAIFVFVQLRTARRERRNLKKWEKGEPFDSVNGWD